VSREIASGARNRGIGSGADPGSAALDDPDPVAWEQMERTRQVEAVQAVVERVGYDGIARQISIRFHPPAITTVQEARA
jgi:hypothetical protein